MADVTIRPATADDLPFLLETMVEIANSPYYRRTREDLLADPRVRHYVEGWPRPSDVGVIAVRGERPVGVAWVRFFGEDERSDGFVSEDIPELAVGVDAAERGKGAGRLLMTAVHDAARAAGIRRTSLSVDRPNRAAEMYLAQGYQEVRSTENSRVMVLEL
ncbi:GNAT family N-acetyltransferase [Labedaea rhizosphaerae]|nr:GNAT family N-acetyltransferase [Labedaea rhizosphaerae]